MKLICVVAEKFGDLIFLMLSWLLEELWSWLLRFLRKYFADFAFSTELLVSVRTLFLVFVFVLF